MSDDAALLSRYADQRDESAFSEFVARKLPLVYSAALRRLDGNGASAAEVAQHVFLRVARDAARLARHPRLEGWLYATTRNAALNLRRSDARREQRHAMIARALDDAAAQQPPPWDKVRPVLDAAMDDLGSNDREAVLLRFFHGYGFAEIGERLRLGDSAARMRVDRALDKLRHRLAARGITSTSAALALLLSAETTVAAPAGLAASVTTGALAGATVASGLAIPALLFMTKTKLALLAAGMIAAAGVGVALHEARSAAATDARLQSAQRDLAAVRADVSSLRTELAAAARRVTAAESRAQTLHRELETATAAKPSATPTSVPPAPDARMLQAQLEKYRKSLRVTYAPLFRKLALSPEQIGKFEAAMTECEATTSDLWATAFRQGVADGGDSSQSTAVARMTSEPIAARDAALAVVLGEQGAAEFHTFDAPDARAAREQFNAVNDALFAAAAPLSPAQGEQLSQIIRENTTIVRQPMADDGAGTMVRLTPRTDWNAVTQQSRPLLNDAQLATLRDTAEQQRLAGEVADLAVRPAPGNTH